MTRWLVTCGALVAMAGAAYAHHSIAGVYDRTQEVTVDGIVSEFRFVQPHPFIVILVRRGGAAAPWHLELDNRRELVEIGFTAETLKPGDRVVVTGSLARREPQRLYVRRLDRPADGFLFEQAGGRPRIRRSAQ